jgi:AraC family transcriptional regulator of adaptative response/methylated-DNA-[protein]-cysteine methyltransferase
MHPAITEDPRWPLLQSRETSADESFWYSVKTTGVYCRPSCPSRPARPENITFHASIEAAEEAGFRPCRRCNPRGLTASAANTILVEQACRTIESAETEPSLAILAAAAQLSPSHFQRLFTAITGLSPKSYAAAQRAARLRDSLATSETVTEAIYASGFNSTGRFYENAQTILGMSPAAYRAGAPQETFRIATRATSLGTLLIALSATGIAAILLGDDAETLKNDLQVRFPKATLAPAGPDAAAQLAKIIALIETPKAGLDLPLDIRGTAFQQRVWQALRAIPPGATTTYAQIAQKIGAPAATRAVANACAANKLAVAIPCHRVIRTDGGLASYRWGPARKRALLAREAAE